jgi:hypothetical protein
MGLEPRLDGRPIPPGQQVDHPAAFQVDQDRPVHPPLPQGEVVDADEPVHRLGAVRRGRHPPQQGVPAGRHAQFPGHPRAGFATQGEPEDAVQVRETGGGPGVGVGHPGQPFAEQPAVAPRVCATEFTGGDDQNHPPRSGRQAGERPPVTGVDAVGPVATDRAWGRRGRLIDGDGDQLGGSGHGGDRQGAVRRDEISRGHDGRPARENTSF